MIPKDPVMLLSYINTQLRDNYSSPEALADGLAISREELDDIVNRLGAIGYNYDEKQNKFI